jgi:multiple sugar transport system permease protein
LAYILGILDTRWVLILAYQILTITFTILMMRGFIQNVPEEFEEAARIEGCSQFQAFFLITLPLVRGGLFATAVFLFLYSWNEFPYALFLTTFRARTLPTGVEYFLGTQGVDWNAAMAYGFMSVIPVLLAAVFLRRYLIQGLTFGVGASK